MKIELTFTSEEILAALQYKYPEVYATMNWKLYFHSKDLKSIYEVDKMILQLGD